MFKKLFNIFKKKNLENKRDLLDEDGNVVKESSLTFDRNNVRFLKLKDDACAIILHPDNNVEVIFTKFYDNQNQNITDNEEVLMALALFMKQRGFLEMIISEFRNIAMNKISTLTNEDGRK